MANAIEDLSKLSFDKKEWITELKNKIYLTGKLEAEDIQIAPARARILSRYFLK